MHNSDTLIKLDVGKQKLFNKVWLARKFVISTNLILALFSPLVSFYMGILFLLACSQYVDRKTVKWIGYVCAYSGSIMAASRKTLESSDDFTHYYAAYLHILNDGWSAIFDSYGTEIGLPIYYFALSRLGITNQIFPLFAVAMLSSAIFVKWLDKYGSSYFPSSRYGTMMAISLLFYNFFMATEATRQTMSLSFLLIAISVAGLRSLVWLFCALLLHQSSLLMFIMFKYAKRMNWFSVILVLCLGIVFMLFFNQVVEIAVTSDIDFIRVASKLSYYTTSNETYTDADMSGLKFISISCFVALLSAKYMPQGWGLLVLLVGVLYVLFLPYPLVSLRTFLIFVAILAGYIASFMAFRIGWTQISWLAFIYALYTILKQFNVADNYPFTLWDKFDWIGHYPFYYFLK